MIKSNMSPLRQVARHYWYLLMAKVRREDRWSIPEDIVITITASASIIFDNGIKEFSDSVAKVARQAAEDNAKAFLRKYD